MTQNSELIVMTFIHNSRFDPILLVLVVLMFLAGCAPSAGRQSQLMRQASKADGKEFQMSAAELRFRLNILAGTLVRIVEDTADEILDETPDRDIRLNVMRWKIDAIPIGLRALFHSDPGIALLDFWGFTIQMTNYIETNQGNAYFGRWNSVAVEACRTLEDYVKRLASDVPADGDVSRVEKDLREWAEIHPIAGFKRESAIPDLTTIAGEALKGTFETIGSLPSTMEDLAFQMAIYAELLPKQSRWQAELMMDNLVNDQTSETGISAIVDVGSSMKRIASVAEELEDVIASERQKAIQSLRQERLETLAALDTIRIDIQRFVSNEMEAGILELRVERKLVTDILREERMAAMETLGDQLKMVLNDIDRQRTLSIQELEAMRQRLTDDSVEQGKRLIDHFFWRALQLSVLLLLLVGLVGSVLWKLLQMKRQV